MKLQSSAQALLPHDPGHAAETFSRQTLHIARPALARESGRPSSLVSRELTELASPLTQRYDSGQLICVARVFWRRRDAWPQSLWVLAHPVLLQRDGGTQRALHVCAAAIVQGHHSFL